jgi:Kef-type K+ transport system membrane component KefB
MKYSLKSFRYGLASLCLWLIAFGLILASTYWNFRDQASVWVGLVLLIASACSFLGLVNSLKSVKEEGGKIKWMGGILNVVLFLAFLALLVENFFDISQ